MCVVSNKVQLEKKHPPNIFGVCFQQPFKQREPFSFTLARVFGFGFPIRSTKRNRTIPPRIHPGDALGKVFIRPWWHTLHLKTDWAHPWQKGWLGNCFFFSGYYLIWLWTLVFIFLGEGKIWVCTRCHVKMACVQDTFVFFLTFVPNPFSKRYVFCLETRCILCSSVHSPSFGRHPEKHGGIQFTSDLAS